MGKTYIGRNTTKIIKIKQEKEFKYAQTYIGSRKIKVNDAISISLHTKKNKSRTTRKVGVVFESGCNWHGYQAYYFKRALSKMAVFYKPQKRKEFIRSQFSWHFDFVPPHWL